MQALIEFLASPNSAILAGIVLASAIVIWNWRYVLFSLLFVQLVVGVSLANSGAVPLQWAIIQIAITALSCTIIGLSAYRTVPTSTTARQSGTWWLRLLAVAMLFAGWRILHFNPNFPQLTAPLMQLFIWIAGCALLTLGLGDNPLYAGFALVLWMIPVQSFIAVVVHIPSLVALAGILQILISLAISYLLISDFATESTPRIVLTDVAFPSEMATLPVDIGIGSVAGTLEVAMRRQWQVLQSKGQEFIDAQRSGNIEKDKTDKTESALPSERSEGDATTADRTTLVQSEDPGQIAQQDALRDRTTRTSVDRASDIAPSEGNATDHREEDA